MYQPYRDITSKLGMPLWWDEEGVPRYEKFEPRLTSDIYAELRALIEIRCQGCNRTFPVACTWGINALLMREDWKERVVWDSNGHNPRPKNGMPSNGEAGFCGYGDAPWHDYDGGLDGQCSGTTMTTDVVRILEFWERNDKLDWVRNPAHEIYVGEDAESITREAQ